MKNIVICDLDGTLFDASHREHLIRCPEPNWAEFFARCGDDPPKWDVARLVKRLSVSHHVVYISGRPESVRRETENALARVDLPPGPLYLRADDDFRPDHVIKREVYETHLRDRVWLVLEDRSSVVKMWRSLGLTCLQVAEGDF